MVVPFGGDAEICKLSEASVPAIVRGGIFAGSSRRYGGTVVW